MIITSLLHANHVKESKLTYKHKNFTSLNFYKYLNILPLCLFLFFFSEDISPVWEPMRRNDMWTARWHSSELQTRAAYTRFPFLVFHRLVELLFLPYQRWQIMSCSPNIDLTRVNVNRIHASRKNKSCRWYRMHAMRKTFQKFTAKFFPTSALIGL